jgi:hypothetical protein
MLTEKSRAQYGLARAPELLPTPVQLPAHLRGTYGNRANIELLGFADQISSADLSHLLGRSWILVNAAAREGLPNVSIEAPARGCAILSALDADRVAELRSAHYVKSANVRALRNGPYRITACKLVALR